MPPGLAASDAPDMGRMNPILTSNESGRSNVVSNCQDLFASKLGVGVYRRRATLGCFVEVVVFSCAQEEMSDIDANRRVASVENTKFGGDRTFRYLPCQPVGEVVHPAHANSGIAAGICAGPTQMTSRQSFWDRVVIQALLGRPSRRAFKSCSHFRPPDSRNTSDRFLRLSTTTKGSEPWKPLQSLRSSSRSSAFCRR